MTDSRRGTSRPGNSFRDTNYDQIEARLETQYGLPAGGMKAIRTRGERSNADQVSSAGARTVYQIIPATAAGLKKNYGLDVYANPEAAARGAAILLHEGMRRNNGSWEASVGEYHGGVDRDNWGPINRAYRARVTGQPVPHSEEPIGGRGQPLPSIDEIDWLNTAPNQMDWAKRPIGPDRKDPRMSPETRRQRELTSLLGPGGVATPVAVKNTPQHATEQAEYLHGVETENERILTASPYRPDAVDPKYRRDLAHGSDLMNFGHRMAAAADEEWFLPQMARAFDQAHAPFEEGYRQYYAQNRAEIEKDAQTPYERQQLRETTSRASLAWVMKDIDRSRSNHKVLDATGHAEAYSLLAGLTDPAGWAAGFGVGKAFEVAGVGSRILAQQGKKAAAVGSMALEGAAGNVAFTGMLDAAGRATTSEDYGMSALTGLGLGLLMSPLAVRGKPDLATPAYVAKAAEEAAAAKADRLVRATKNLGEGAAPEAVAKEAERLDAADKASFLHSLLADIPDSERLLHSDPEQLLTKDETLKSGIETRYNLAAIADPAERALVAEHMARAEAIVAANPVDEKALKTILSAAGMESTGLRLMASESPVARAVAIKLLESTTGAGGRGRTAAMSMHTRERLYNQVFQGFDNLYHEFRKGEGVGMMEEFVSGKVRRQFNDRVFAEIEDRAGKPEGITFDSSPHVVEAADLWERGMTAIRKDLQHVDAVGAKRLGDTSRGYVTHRLDNRKVTALTPQQQSRVRAELEAQFVDPANGFDEEFAKKLSQKYLERALDAAKGGFDVPMNLRSPEAAQIVSDALEAMNLPYAEREAMMGKFSRGGAGFTQQRLRLNLNADIGDGMVLRDLFVTDMSSLYRGYARRAAGEVSLAQYGIMGKKGINELRKAISASGGSADDVKAFDQVAAEFLNTPFGEHNHKYMDNIRTATSVARLGGMGFTQFAEYGNGIAALGIHRVFAAIGALPRLVREVSHLSKGGIPANPILQSIDTLGGSLGLDEYRLSRWWDVKDNDIQLYSAENIGVGTRALRAGAHLQATLTGQRMITAVQVRGMAEQIVHKTMKFVRDGGEDLHLRDMGITEDLQAAIKADLANIAEFDSSGKLTALDLTKSKMKGHDIARLRDAIERGSSQIIQRTYIGETGKWAHDGLLKMLAQFRTFGVTSVEKQWGRNVKNFGAIKSSMYLLGAMSFAVPIHVARVQSKMLGMSRTEREKYADEHLSVGSLARATMNYASASGLAGDVLDIGGGFASSFGGTAGDEFASSMGVRGTKGQSKLVGGVIAPGVGLLEDTWAGIHGDGKKLSNLLPGANLPYAQPIIGAFAANEE